MTQTFAKLGLSEPVLKALVAEDYTNPTPIQTKAIPHVLEGRDILGIAQTGTGKTAAFALPIIDRLLAENQRPPAKGCRALILSPTRELATQIADSFKTYARFTRLSVTTVFGGVGARPQIRALSRGVDVLVATPGRLLDHIQSGHCDLSNTRLLVLDEADQMLDLGFLKPIRAIAGRTSRERQSLFFSATFPKEIEAISRELLRDPVSVRVTPVASTAERVAQKVIHVDRAKKAGLLVELLGNCEMVRTLVFTRTKRGADNVAKMLDKNGIRASAIHGNKSQSQRERALDGFRLSKVHVLVATDIAARGIDIPEVSHVVNYDLPEVPESYVHRIGRTARAGRSGQAISLCDPSERKLLRDIEKVTKQTIASERGAVGGDGDDRPAPTAAREGAGCGSREEASRGGRRGEGRPRGEGRARGEGRPRVEERARGEGRAEGPGRNVGPKRASESRAPSGEGEGEGNRPRRRRRQRPAGGSRGNRPAYAEAR